LDDGTDSFLLSSRPCSYCPSGFSPPLFLLSVPVLTVRPATSFVRLQGWLHEYARNLEKHVTAGIGILTVSLAIYLSCAPTHVSVMCLLQQEWSRSRLSVRLQGRLHCWYHCSFTICNIMCTLNKVWKNMFVKRMMFYCTTLLSPYEENHTQSARLTSGAKMLDLRSEALS
jgi:hypothetical protein